MAGDRPGMVLVEDPASFTEPRARALADAVAAFGSASRPVKGAEARVHAALADLKTLREFSNRVSHLMETRGFAALPELVHDGDRLDGLRHLTVGPWRGVFLIGEDPAVVVGLLFSREPHALADRLDEIARPHRPAAAEPVKDPSDDDHA